MKLLLKLCIPLAVSLAAALAFLPSYFGTALDRVVASVRGQVPIEFEIERAQNLIKRVEPQIEVCKREVALAEVSLETLDREVVGLTDRVAQAEQKLEQGAKLLGGQDTAADVRVVTAGLAPTGARERVALNLKRGLDALRNDRDLLKSKAGLRDRQRAAVDAARARLEAVRSEKLRLEDMVASLRVQLAQVEALAATAPDTKLDDSALGDAKRVLAEIKKDLDVRQKMLEQDMVFAVGPAELPVAAELVLAEVQEYLAGRPAAAR